MDAIHTRTGEKIRLIYFDESGAQIEIKDNEEFDFIYANLKIGVSILPNLLKVITHSITTLRLSNLYLVGKIAVKQKILHRDSEKERLLLLEGLTLNKLKFSNAGYHFEIIFRDRHIWVTNQIEPAIFFEMVHQIFIQNQYDLTEQNIRGKVVIDAGAHIGTFSLMCAALGAEKIYAFEPLKENYKLLRENVDRNNMQAQIIPLNKALGDRECLSEITYRTGAGYAAHISDPSSLEKNTQQIEITTVDRFMGWGGQRVDFIKMDVEGFEENIILGAKETIKKYKPVLSFAAYHIPDKWKLAEAVRRIREDYTITLNSFAEEDFYCE